MLGYLFDASAVVHFYVPDNGKIQAAIEFLYRQKSELQTHWFIPNVCIAEVFKAIAKYRYDKTQKTNLTADEYNRCLDDFRRDIHWGKKFYPYDLNRYHVIAADEIIPFEFEVERKARKSRETKYDFLSSLDILVIAMACELSFLYGQQKITLVTKDSRMSRVCDQMRRISDKDRQNQRVYRLFKDIPIGRWPVPRVFNILMDDPLSLPHVIHGTPVNEMRA
ncbi:MAG: hypothetical protein HY046_08195 [Acidobacteria bacterium]|nr:hypothetical protein [Acidobacteriota bacterium]